MDLSYRERSILGSLAATVAVFGIYFAKLLRVSRGGPLEAGDVLWMMIAAVIALFHDLKLRKEMHDLEARVEALAASA